MEERRYDLYSDSFRASTYETYAAMRERSPVFKQPGLDGTTPIWFVTRHHDVVALLLDDERFVLDPALALTPEELEQRPSPIPAEFLERIRRLPALRLAAPPDSLDYRPIPLFRSLVSLPDSWS